MLNLEQVLLSCLQKWLWSVPWYYASINVKSLIKVIFKTMSDFDYLYKLSSLPSATTTTLQFYKLNLWQG